MTDRIAGQDPPRLLKRVAWPTLLVAAAVYGGFGLATWYHQALPWWLLLPLGGYLVAWHGSLQHEVVHGHPTPWNWVNEALVFPSLWLWLPFRLYRVTHLDHHNDEILTDPARDPESFYVAAVDWDRMAPLGRAYFRIANTPAGRLLIQPLRCVWPVVPSSGGATPCSWETSYTAPAPLGWHCTATSRWIPWWPRVAGPLDSS